MATVEAKLLHLFVLLSYCGK